MPRRPFESEYLLRNKTCQTRCARPRGHFHTCVRLTGCLPKVACALTLMLARTFPRRHSRTRFALTPLPQARTHLRLLALTRVHEGRTSCSCECRAGVVPPVKPLPRAWQPTFRTRMSRRMLRGVAGNDPVPALPRPRRGSRSDDGQLSDPDLLPALWRERPPTSQHVSGVRGPARAQV